MQSTPPHTRRSDHGFTLVELLIVIVILGILATVVVFAIQGITDQGNENAESTDARTLTTAQEAYYAEYGEYGEEAELVTAGLLREQSTFHDVSLSAGGSDYELVSTAPGGGDGGGGGGGGAPTPEPEPEPEPMNVAQATTFGGHPALRYGTGAKTLVFLESQNPTARSQFDAWVASNPPIPDTQFIFITDGLTSVAAVEAAITQGATADAAAYTYGYRWAPGIGTNVWWIRGGGYGAFGSMRNPGLPNVLQWDGGVDVAGVVQMFQADY